MRLNKQVKEAILNAALKKAGIPDREAAIKNRYAQWAEAVRVRYVTPLALAAFDTMVSAAKDIPEGVLYERPSLNTECGIRNANVAGQSRDVFFNGVLSYPDLSKDRLSRPAPSYGTVTLLADDPLTEQLYAIDHDAKALTSEREQLTVSLWAVLDSVTTDKRLVEVWPEAIAFIPAAERAATVQLPALPIADLNKMIGLP